mmetsp:Transcript_2373/g.4909  ORF Transcript_2373/g.4909 Transcript_2373/m.4909 type:complete len:142 (+) Transcript_2373:2439-2864(+)
MSFSFLHLFFGVSRDIEKKYSAFGSNVFAVLVDDACSDYNEKIVLKIVLVRSCQRSSCVRNELRQAEKDTDIAVQLALLGHSVRAIAIRITQSELQKKDNITLSYLTESHDFHTCSMLNFTQLVRVNYTPTRRSINKPELK